MVKHQPLRNAICLLDGRMGRFCYERNSDDFPTQQTMLSLFVAINSEAWRARLASSTTKSMNLCPSLRIGDSSNFRIEKVFGCFGSSPVWRRVFQQQPLPSQELMPHLSRARQAVCLPLSINRRPWEVTSTFATTY